MLGSPFGLLKFDHDVADDSTVSKRTVNFGKIPLKQGPSSKPVYILVNSSGLTVHVGRMRNIPKCWDWRRLHIAVDEQTGDVVGCDLTILGFAMRA